jgi:hypothetical protein
MRTQVSRNEGETFTFFHMSLTELKARHTHGCASYVALKPRARLSHSSQQVCWEGKASTWLRVFVVRL